MLTASVPIGSQSIPPKKGYIMCLKLYNALVGILVLGYMRSDNQN